MEFVRIRWLDAHSEHQLSDEELQEVVKDKSELAPYDCVGFLLKETDSCYIIAQGCLAKNSSMPFDQTLWREVLFVPKVLVQSVTRLEEIKNRK